MEAVPVRGVARWRSGLGSETGAEAGTAGGLDRSSRPLLPLRPMPRALSLPDGREVQPGKVLCIGRNYVAHVIEMGGREGDQPVVFLKPSTALVADGGEVVLPRQSADVHHEVELVAVIGKAGKDIARGRRARPRRGLRRRARHDGPRPPGRRQGRREALERRQGVRHVRPARPARRRGRGGRPPGARRRAHGRRRDPPAGLDVDDGVLGRPDRLVPVVGVHARARRPGLHRHARGRRAGPRRPDAGGDRDRLPVADCNRAVPTPRPARPPLCTRCAWLRSSSSCSPSAPTPRRPSGGG